MTKSWREIPGWFDCDNLYSKMIKDAKDGAHFVEIGAWLGRSTCFMAQYIKNSGKKIKFDTVDTFEGNPGVKEHSDFIAKYGPLYDIYLQNLKDCELENYITTHKMTSEEASKLYKDNSLDFVFIDGSHDYEDVLIDIKSWFPKIKNGGIIAGDDYGSGWPGVDKAVDEMFKKEVFNCSPIWVVIK